jgi:hypothetical protein
MKKIIAVLALSFMYSALVSADCAVSDSEKVDCGVLGTTKDSCQANGCCWAESSTPSAPFCFYQAGASASCFGYQVNLLSFLMFKTKTLNVFIIVIIFFHLHIFYHNSR